MTLRVPVLCVLVCLGCGAVDSQGEIMTATKSKVVTGKETGALAVGEKDYIGSKVCGGCHPENYEGWKTTLHSRMVQEPDQPGALVADLIK